MARWIRVLELLTVVVLLFFAIPIQVPSPDERNLKELFNLYMQKFNKTYQVDTYEYNKRFEAFKNAHSAIELYNSLRIHNNTALYGYTQFSDLTKEEFIANHLVKPKKQKHYGTKSSNYTKLKENKNSEKYHSSEENRVRRQISTSNLPSKVDWRNNGIISKVRNQGLCGSCWAFSTIHTIEAMYAKTHNLTSLSVQQAIDCATNGNYGCLGGDICALLAWLVNYNVTIEFEDKYPMNSKSEQCFMKKSGPVTGTRVKSYSCYRLASLEDEILWWLANKGPVAVAINALSWQNYLGGVIQYHCSSKVTSMNHAVQIVGYDLTAEIPYYIAKNSWGTFFGNQGYVHLAIGENICGLANEVSMIEVY